MGVLIEGVNVVIRNATVDARYPGGMREYARDCPSDTFCTDGEICRVGFMATADAVSYVDTLEFHAFRRPTVEGSPEVALVSQTAGFDFPCDWLELACVEVGDGLSAEVAWISGTTLSELAAPPHWKPGSMRVLPTEDLNRLEFLGTKEGVDVFRDPETDGLIYVGRTQEGAPPAGTPAGVVGERFASLADELKRLGAFEGVDAGDYQGDLASLYERAKQLVEDTQEREPGPLHLQGIVARLLGRWGEAARLFRQVAELRPDYVDCWLELTWALASLRRFEEAELSARRAVELDPNHPGALGNLAGALLERGALDEAQLVIRKALLADPADEKNAILEASIRRAVSRKVSWWRRHFGAGRD
jgi:hypothetical protein